mgnify:CR=1 FL=1
MDKKLKGPRLIANLLDSQFKFGKVSFGLESFLGFLPLIGDALGILLALYIYRVGHTMGISKKHKAQMLFNIALDFVMGLIPFLGDAFDIFYKANIKNLEILEKHGRGKVIEGEIVD